MSRHCLPQEPGDANRRMRWNVVKLTPGKRRPVSARVRVDEVTPAATGCGRKRPSVKNESDFQYPINPEK